MIFCRVGRAVASPANRVTILVGLATARPTTNGGESVIVGDYGTGIWNQTGGTTSVANQICGANQAGSAAQLNVSGGYLSAGKYILLTQSGAAALNLSGSGLVTIPASS